MKGREGESECPYAKERMKKRETWIALSIQFYTEDGGMRGEKKTSYETHRHRWFVAAAAAATQGYSILLYT